MASPFQRVEGFLAEFFDHHILKQNAIKPANIAKLDLAALRHRLEQLLGVRHKVMGLGARLLDNLGEQALAAQPSRQQTHIFREQAEDQPGQEMRDPFRRGISGAHVVGDVFETARRLRRDLPGGTPRVVSRKLSTLVLSLDRTTVWAAWTNSALRWH